MTSNRNTRLLAGIVAAPFVVGALHRLPVRPAAALAKRSEPLQVAPAEPEKRLLIVGDSTGVGTGASTPQDSLAGLIAAEHPSLAIVNRSADGATVDRIAAQLEGGGRFDAVLILGGGNDMIRMTGAEALRAALSRVLFLARARRRQRRADAVRQCRQRAVLPVALVGADDACARVCCTRSHGRRRLPTGRPTSACSRNAPPIRWCRSRGACLAADRLHPSDAGYALWHRELSMQSNLGGRAALRPAWAFPARAYFSVLCPVRPGAAMSLRINDIAPDFEAERTQGKIRFHQWIGDKWAILFSHRRISPRCARPSSATWRASSPSSRSATRS